MDLQELRLQIDHIDSELIRLFEQRLEVSADIARYKQRQGIPVFDPLREREKLRDVTGRVEEGHGTHIAAFFSLLFEISRSEQERLLQSGEVL